MGVNKILILSMVLGAAWSVCARPRNVILVVADDISAREFPFYESSMFTGDRRAKTPMMDRMAENGGCFIETFWAATICKPSGVLLMNGTYACNNKYWDNSHIGADCNNTYAAYESAPITLGNMSRDAGYANIWVSKTHIGGGADILSMGFNELVLDPAEPFRHSGWNPFGTPNKNPYPVFRTNNPDDWDHKSFFWWPEIQLINHPDHPNEPFAYAKTEIDDYAPDLEMEYIFDFMDRSKAADKPFFVLHTPHLGHLAKDCAVPGTPTVWPGTPVLEWKNGRYVRKEPKHIPREDGTYERKNITPEGLSRHVEYLDYHMWQYIEKLKAIGELENTIILFSADNGTQDNAGNFGKGRITQQQGMHVPLLIYAPGVKNLVHGRRNIVADFADVLPTLAEIMGFQFPQGYDKLDGQSLWPYLTGESKKHRDWIYSMRIDAQMIRNDKVLRDGQGTWYDVNKRPGDFHSFTRLDDLPNGEYKNRLLAEKAKLEPKLAKFDLYNVDSEAPLPPPDADGDGISDAFEEKYGALNPGDDLDGDGVDNFHEYVHGGDPRNPKSPSKEQLPHLIEVSDAQGTYLAMQFQRLEELGPDYWFVIEGSNDGEKWTTDGVMQQHTLRSNGDGSERVIARVAADKSKSNLKQLRLTVHKPVKRNLRKYKNLLK
ncbi:sulfatase-like hydrolase/transferase [Pontiella sulfatireligans]|uniref:Arylsulfatase n=1 Tax=Pontiella sulfatireligans TaxID=2750658 RepID=A0A6C2UQG2_9BACT|nr:sulfatase-like hydrolase/transferase [Pontiella sulfatireligans]VGO21511.1 Arylsulfatase [Pontiella sulfatireligans]